MCLKFIYPLACAALPQRAINVIIIISMPIFANLRMHNNKAANKTKSLQQLNATVRLPLRDGKRSTRFACLPHMYMCLEISKSERGYQHRLAAPSCCAAARLPRALCRSLWFGRHSKWLWPAIKSAPDHLLLWFLLPASCKQQVANVVSSSPSPSPSVTTVLTQFSAAAPDCNFFYEFIEFLRACAHTGVRGGLLRRTWSYSAATQWPRRFTHTET